MSVRSVRHNGELYLSAKDVVSLIRKLALDRSMTDRMSAATLAGMADGFEKSWGDK